MSFHYNCLKKDCASSVGVPIKSNYSDGYNCTLYVTLFTPASSAPLIDRMRCLLMNFVHSEEFYDEEPCSRHVRLYRLGVVEDDRDYYTKSAIFSIKDARVASSLGAKALADHPEVTDISLQVSTTRTPYGLCQIICGVYALDDKQRVIEVETNGERKGQWTTFCAAFEGLEIIGDAGRRDPVQIQAKYMKTWGNFVRFLRDVTAVNFKGTGEPKIGEWATIEDDWKMKIPVELRSVGLDESWRGEGPWVRWAELPSV